MTPKEFGNKLRLQLLELQRNNRPLALAATSTATAMATRIFIEGKNSSGGKIGDYNNTSIMYLNPTNAKVFDKSKIGTPGTFKNGNKRKTVKLTYKGYKSAIGKPAGGAFVNLQLSGDLKFDFTNVKLSDNDGTAIPNQVSVNEYNISVDEDNMDKIRGNEAKFGVIFKHTTDELRGPKGFYKILEFELRRAFS